MKGLLELRRNFFHHRERWILLLLLVFLCIPWLRDIAKGEVHLITDETRHAMNGLFLLDFMRDLPLGWPLQYAYEYYGKYPAVAIGHWPPAFYLFEAIFFGIFGISVWISRLAIIPFAFLGAFFWYRIARCYACSELALASMVIYACLPSVLLYEKSTMLEIPTLALCLGAIYYWLVLFRTGRPRYLYAAAFFAAWALLTKQNAVFLVPLFVVHLFLERKWTLLKWRHTYIALLGVAVLVVPWYAFVAQMHPTVVQQMVGVYSDARIPMSGLVTYYPLSLPGELGLPLLVLSLLGIRQLLVDRESATLRFFLAWILVCYLTFTPISDKGPRHIMSWLLPFIYFAVYFVWRLFARWPRLRVAVLVGLMAAYYIPALSYQRPYIEGCEEAARFVTQQPDSDTIFYQGTLNGDFIFFVRKFDPEKRRLVVREKAIVALNAPLGRGESAPAVGETPPLLQKAEKVKQMFRELGIRYFVVENQDFRPELAVTHLALQSESFELVREIPIRTNDYRVAGIKLLVYRTKEPAPPTTAEIEIPMSTLRYDLRLRLARLAGRPWPPANSGSN